MYWRSLCLYHYFDEHEDAERDAEDDASNEVEDDTKDVVESPTGRQRVSGSASVFLGPFI